VAPSTAAPAAPSPQAPAATSPAPQPFPADAKIGFIDPQAVLEGSVAGKAGIAQLNKLVETKQAELQAKNKIIQTLSQEIQTSGSVLTGTVLASKQSELTKHQNELQFMQKQAQDERDALEQRMLQDFQDKVIPIVEQLRTEKGLWAILTPNAQAAAVDPRLDLSAEVVKRLDAAK
jgi:outer membrane protein